MRLAAALGCLALLAAATVTAVEPPSAAEVEAAYLLNFIKYTDWPGEAAVADGEEDAQAAATAPPDAAPADTASTDPAPSDLPPYVVSVVASGRLADTYARVAAAAGRVNGRAVHVRDVDYLARGPRRGHARAHDDDVAMLRDSHLVFIDRSAARSIPFVLRDLEGWPVLTVSNVEGFVEDGGMLELLRVGRSIVFTANPEAIREAGIMLSSRVLTLARNSPGAP